MEPETQYKAFLRRADIVIPDFGNFTEDQLMSMWKDPEEHTSNIDLLNLEVGKTYQMCGGAYTRSGDNRYSKLFYVIETSSRGDNGKVINGISFRDALKYNRYEDTLNRSYNRKSMLSRQIDIVYDYNKVMDKYQQDLNNYYIDIWNGNKPTEDNTKFNILNSSLDGYKTYYVRFANVDYSKKDIEHMLVIQDEHNPNIDNTPPKYPHIYLCTYDTIKHEKYDKLVDKLENVQIYNYTPTTDIKSNSANSSISDLTNSGAAVGGKTRRRKCKTLKRSRKPKPKSRKSKLQRK